MTRLKDEKGQINEYRVGPVPPESGEGYRDAKTATLKDYWRAARQVRTRRVMLAAYIKRRSRDGYQWVGDVSHDRLELAVDLYSAIESKMSEEEFIGKFMSTKYDVPRVMAVSFIEVPE